MPETGENRLARERRDPQAFDRLAAAGQRVDEIEDQLTLPPGVGCVDDCGHVCTLEELCDDVELIAGCLGGMIGKWRWAERQVCQAPLLPRRIVRLRCVEFDQVSDAPGDKVAGPLQVADTARGRPKGCRDRTPHRRLLRDDDPLARRATRAGAPAPGGAARCGLEGCERCRCHRVSRLQWLPYVSTTTSRIPSWTVRCCGDVSTAVASGLRLLQAELTAAHVERQ